METPQGITLGTIVVIVVFAVASGPLLGLSLTAESSRSAFDPSSGSLQATIVSTPDTATVERARFDADVAHLNAPPVQLDVSNVTGQPTISYKLRIDDLGYATSTVSFLDESVSGRYALEFREQTVDPERFESDEYDTTLIVVVRDDAGERVLVEENVTTEVRT